MVQFSGASSARFRIAGAVQLLLLTGLVIDTTGGWFGDWLTTMVIADEVELSECSPPVFSDPFRDVAVS